MRSVNCQDPVKETRMLVSAVPQVEEGRNGISFLNCSHRFTAVVCGCCVNKVGSVLKRLY